jgi:hypothetical protein
MWDKPTPPSCLKPSVGIWWDGDSPSVTSLHWTRKTFFHSPCIGGLQFKTEPLRRLYNKEQSWGGSLETPSNCACRETAWESVVERENVWHGWAQEFKQTVAQEVKGVEFGGPPLQGEQVSLPDDHWGKDMETMAGRVLRFQELLAGCEFVVRCSLRLSCSGNLKTRNSQSSGSLRTPDHSVLGRRQPWEAVMERVSV